MADSHHEHLRGQPRGRCALAEAERQAGRPLCWSPRFQHVVFSQEASARRTLLGVPRRTEAPAAFALPRPSSAAEPDLDAAVFLRWLLEQAHLSVRTYRIEMLERRLPACLRMLRVATPWQARRRIEQSPSLVPAALDTLLLGVTSFFRDAAVFDALRHDVLPTMASERDFLRVWSIGCSDGAEVYSLGILLSDLGLSQRSYVLGMDVRPDAIAHAKAGLYDEPALRHVPDAWRQRYFRPQPPLWEVARERLPAIGWWVHNALAIREAGVWDLIVCRNMIMYFGPAAATDLWRHIEGSLRPGGVLVVGKAERPAGTRLMPIGPCLYRRMGGR